MYKSLIYYIYYLNLRISFQISNSLVYILLYHSTYKSLKIILQTYWKLCKYSYFIIKYDKQSDSLNIRYSSFRKLLLPVTV